MTVKTASSNVLKGIVSLTLFSYFSINFLQNLNVSASNNDVCPNGNGWTKVDSDNLSSYPVAGATQYCFKAGNDNSKGCVGGKFDTWPVTGQGKICGLSHWSYYIPTVQPSPSVIPSPTPEVSPSPSASPQVSPSPELEPSPSPEVDPSPSPELRTSPTPEASPSPTPEVSPSVSPTPSVTPSPTSSSNSNNGVSSNNQSSSNQTENRVLGVSSDQPGIQNYAATGMNPQLVFNFIGMVGSVFVGLSSNVKKSLKK